MSVESQRRSSLVQQEDLFTTTAHPCLGSFSAHVGSSGCEGEVEQLSSDFLTG